MQLPAIQSKLVKISITRKRLLFIFLSFLLIILVTGVILVCNLLYSEAYLMNLARSYPQLANLIGVQKTDLSFRKDGLSVSKELNQFTVSGEITKVEKDKLTIRLEEGTERSYLVKEGSKFIIVGSPDKLLDYETGGKREYVFDGKNLEEFLLPGFYLTLAKLSDSKISSEETKEGFVASHPIVVSRGTE